jgi:hypothetical protein
MGRIFGILFIVLAVWTGVEVYNEGAAGAFGGLFVRLGLAEEEMELEDVPVAGRAANRLNELYEASGDRVERQAE